MSTGPYSYSYGDVYGGYIASQDSTAAATGNTITAYGSIATGNVIGGDTEGKGDATQNNVSIYYKTQIVYNVYGGYSKYGNTSNNIVDVENSRVFWGTVYGGLASQSGNSTDNKVTIGGTTEVGNGYPLDSIFVGGGYSRYGSVTGNTLNVKDSSHFWTNITGGVIDLDTQKKGQGTVSDNHVYMTGGTVELAAFGGLNQGLGNAESNTIDISGGTVDIDVTGGLAFTGSAIKNQVTISGTANVQRDIYGGESATEAGSGTANGNQVNIQGGTVGRNIYGGLTAGTGDVAENSVTVSGGSLQGNVYGGYAKKGNASGNIVNLSGGTFGTEAAEDAATAENVNTQNLLEADNATDEEAAATDFTSLTNFLAGGYAANGDASNNVVNLLGSGIQTSYSLYGGLGQTGTDNTLNVYGLNNSVKNLGYFQTLNFYVPAAAKAGDTMLEVTGTADVRGAKINAGVKDVTQLNPGEAITLLHSVNQEINSADASYNMLEGQDIVTDAALLQRRAYIKPQDANTVVLYVPTDSQPILHPGTEVIADGQSNASTTVAGGSDAAVTDGLQAALSAWSEAHEAARLREADPALGMTASPYTSSPAGMSIRQGTSMAANSPLDAADAKNANVTLSEEKIAQREEREVDDQFTPYVMLGGHNLRYNSSSTVDTNGFNGELGFVKRVFNKNSADTIMPFMEYGTGNYTSFKNGSRGDGSQRYVGAGILLRRDLDNGVHYEGLLRAGRLNGDYAGRIGSYRTTYNSGAGYIAAHAGLGKIFRQDTNDYNLYGKFFYSHLGGDSVTLHSSLGSADYELDSVNSYWTRLGFRWTKHLDEDTTTFYAGLGWDYEFDGKATARYRDYTTPDASMKGSSEFLELGWQSKVTKENPWGADVRVTGWNGVKQGFTYGVTITRRM